MSNYFYIYIKLIYIFFKSRNEYINEIKLITAAYLDIHGLVFIPINTKFLKGLIFFSTFR